MVIQRLKIIAIVLGLLGPTIATPTAIAQQNSGLQVTPPLLTLELTEDQEYHQTTISYTNSSDQSVSLEMDIRDFGNLEDGGGQFFFGTNDQLTRLGDKHSLADWLEIQPQQLTIPAGQQQSATLTIHNRQDLTPGGHYAAVVATIASSSDHNIAINQSLSTLLFVNKLGGHHHELKVEEISPKTAWWGQVEGASLLVQNTGNTHLTPRGKLELQDPLGQTIGQATINQKSTLLLPQSSQSFDGSFLNNQIGWLPGNYTLILSYRYDGLDQIAQQSISVFSLGWLLPSLAVLAVLGSISFIVHRRLRRTAESDY